MRDLQLYIFDLIFFIEIHVYNLIINLLNIFISLTNKGFVFLNWHYNFNFPLNTSFLFAIKFSLSIAFLILIRGGTPRYRYDYLTKLGWLKFLSFIILTFITTLLIFFIF